MPNLLAGMTMSPTTTRIILMAVMATTVTTSTPISLSRSSFLRSAVRWRSCYTIERRGREGRRRSDRDCSCSIFK
jgi:hypothetical protein